MGTEIDLAAASSLLLHQRLARAQEPLPRNLTASFVEGLAEEAQRGIRRAHGWVPLLFAAKGGRCVRRPVSAMAADAPLLVAEGRDRSVAFLNDWPPGRARGYGDDWSLALALGHLELHAGQGCGDPDPETGDGHILYVPHFIARTSPRHGARLEATWYAAALLMPRGLFEAAWREAGRDPALVGPALGADIHADLAAARAEALGIA